MGPTCTSARGVKNTLKTVDNLQVHLPSFFQVVHLTSLAVPEQWRKTRFVQPKGPAEGGEAAPAQVTHSSSLRFMKSLPFIFSQNALWLLKCKSAVAFLLLFYKIRTGACIFPPSSQLSIADPPQLPGLSPEEQSGFAAFCAAVQAFEAERTPLHRQAIPAAGFTFTRTGPGAAGSTLLPTLLRKA